MSAIVGVATAVVTLIAAILGIFKYFDVRSKRQQREAIGAAFKGIVTTLAGTDRVERLGSAILLRRFFNPSSEYSKPDMPYADEAIDVIAATLRGEPTGDVQKVLADGLAYVGVRGLRHKDLQHVNLQHGYVSLSGPAGHAVASVSKTRSAGRRRAAAERAMRSKEGSEEAPQLRLDLSHSDFFGADVSGASFNEDLCVKTVFYDAIAVGTVFKGADLTEANFQDADLRRANFAGATLTDADFTGANLGGARFAGARQLPQQIADRIDDRGVYETTADQPSGQARVFVSAPSVATQTARDVVDMICASVRDEGFEPVRVAPEAYRPDRHLADVKEAMTRCAGVIVVGVPQLTLDSGVWRRGTDDERTLTNEELHTPWNDIETGIGVGLGIPVLSIRAGCADHGVFGLSSLAVGFEQAEPVQWTGASVAKVVHSWAQRALPSTDATPRPLTPS